MTADWDWTDERSIESRRGAHLPFLDEVLSRLADLGWEGRDYFGIEMAIEESLTNAIRHGNKLDHNKKVQISVKLNRDRFRLRVEDEGPGFQSDCVADCTSDEGLQAPSGRGMALIKAYMTHVEHNVPGNCITMEKVRSQE